MNTQIYILWAMYFLVYSSYCIYLSVRLLQAQLPCSAKMSSCCSYKRLTNVATCLIVQVGLFPLFTPYNRLKGYSHLNSNKEIQSDTEM